MVIFVLESRKVVR